jgi:uncharacterized phage protein (TIGR02218 family)
LKTLPVAYQAHLDTGTTTRAYALKITRTDGQVFAWTSASAGVTLGATTYSAAPGLQISSIASTAGLAVDNLELTTIDDGSIFTRAQVLGGVWQAAAWELLAYNWASPADGTEPIAAGTVGEVQLLRGRVIAELRGLQQYLQQPIGNVTSRTCRARFADFPAQAGTNRCGLVAATYTRTDAVTAVTSRQVFTSSTLWAAVGTADYYGEGLLTWTSGNSNGRRIKVKAYATGGVLTLMLPMLGDIQVGDTFSILAGCRKRLAEDCAAKFNNALNFAGEPHLPGVDALTAVPDPSV